MNKPFTPLDFADLPTHALMNITARPPLVFVEGKGSWLKDHQGKSYLDFIQGWAVNALGHSPIEITDALVAQSKLLLTPSPAFYNLPALRLADGLTKSFPFQQVFFTSSGGEANEGAIKLARKWGQKHKSDAFEIITFINGFHGRTLATMSASGKVGWGTMFAPQVPGFPKATLNDIASVKDLITPRTVGIMLEPIQGEGGVVPATLAFMQELRALCDQHRLLLIADEIQTGMGRVGQLSACQYHGVQADIMTLGKGIGAGVPLAALMATEAASVFEHGNQGGTYTGNPLMCAVGLKVLETIREESFLATVRTRGEQLKEGLEKIVKDFSFKQARGLGLLQAIDLGDERGAKLVDTARERGLLINSPRPHLLRFMPSLNLSVDDIDQMLRLLTETIKAVPRA